MALLLVRHAVAKDRHRWDDGDDLRPLTQKGRAQAETLIEQLAGYETHRLLASPSTRCIETVEPLAAARGLEVEIDDRLAEGNGRKAIKLVRDLLDAHAKVALCSHGDVIPEVLDALGVDIRFRCAKGSTWVLDGEDATYLGPLL